MVTLWLSIITVGNQVNYPNPNKNSNKLNFVTFSLMNCIQLWNLFEGVRSQPPKKSMITVSHSISTNQDNSDKMDDSSSSDDVSFYRFFYFIISKNIKCDAKPLELPHRWQYKASVKYDWLRTQTHYHFIYK